MLDNIVSLVSELKTLAPHLKVAVDSPDDKDGEYFIDISHGESSIEVSYRAISGFGFYGRSATYGQRPDEVFRTPKLAVQRVVQLFNSGGYLKPLTLVAMRELRGLTQVDVAAALSVRQPSVQRVENRGDKAQIETIARHIQAMGGKLMLSAVFNDMEVKLDISSTEAV